VLAGGYPLHLILLTDNLVILQDPHHISWPGDLRY
jgi:hypothetical protein